MNGPLQRLVARARGTPDPALRRIEPLLAPRYAAAAAGEALAPELQEQQVAARMPRVAPVPPAASTGAAAPRVGELPDVEAAAEHGAVSDAPIAPAPAQRATSPQESVVLDDDTRTVPMPSATITQLRVERLVEARVETTNGSIAAQVSRADTRRDDPARPLPRAATETSVESRETVVHDATPSVTVSIGRIDVHAPPAPPTAAAAAPRRPAFRPSVTLDAFLRGGGERR